MIVWVASYPRSGNGFFRDVLRTLYGIKSIDLYQLHRYHNFKGLDLARARADKSIYFLKTHQRRPGDDNPTLYLLRDGRDALISYTWYELQHRRGVQDRNAPPELFRRELHRLIRGWRNCLPFVPHPFGSWSSNINGWLGRPQTVPVRFEDLVRDPQETVRSAVTALNLGLTPRARGRVNSFAKLQRDNPKIFRQGKTGSWQEEFPSDLLQLFWRYHGATMHQLGYAKEPCAA